jgi:hypothetical protein
MRDKLRGQGFMTHLDVKPYAGQQASAPPFGCVEAGAAHPTSGDQRPLKHPCRDPGLPQLKRE